MEAKEFFARVDEILDSTGKDAPIGVDYFIENMEELIVEWDRQEED